MKYRKRIKNISPNKLRYLFAAAWRIRQRKLAACLERISRYNYILDEHKNIVPVYDIIEWATWCENNRENKRVSKTTIGDSCVSTVFLGVDHNFSLYGDVTPVLFETMVYNEANETWVDKYTERYCTYAEALMGHSLIVSRIKKKLNRDDKNAERERVHLNG